MSTITPDIQVDDDDFDNSWRRAGRERVTVSEIRISIGVPSGRSSTSTGGRCMHFMFVGSDSSRDFWAVAGEYLLSEGITKVMKRLWWRTSRVANSASGMR